jgi:hypothetical protein
MPSTDRKLELKAKTSVAQTDSQPYVLFHVWYFNLHKLNYMYIVNNIECLVYVLEVNKILRSDDK